MPVPITGQAVLSAMGAGVPATLASLQAGRSLLAGSTMDLPFNTQVGAVEVPLPDLPVEASAQGRLARMALHLLAQLGDQVAMATDRWGPERVALILGTSTGGLRETERAHRSLDAGQARPEAFSLADGHAISAVADLVARTCGLRGPRFVVSTACSSGAKAIAAGQRLITHGVADAVIAGGVDTLCELTLRGFHGLGILSEQGCTPFAANRTGISIGEGGALLLLEREGAGTLELVGHGESSDAHHMSAPHPQGVGAEQAMLGALASAGVDAGRVGHINAHGTGTPHNDAVECAAIERIFAGHAKVASTKAFMGHMLGAAGATEAVLTALALDRGSCPPSLSSQPLDPAINLDITDVPAAFELDHALSNSLAFGGSNISLLFRRRGG